MIFYLTYNDAPSGIYSSQVIDVVKFLRSEFKKDIKLVSFISLRGFLLNRKKIKAELPDAIVLPMFPGIARWSYNQISFWIICLIFQPKIIIGRSVLATQLALKNRKRNIRIIYDGRGAIAAEWDEYEVVKDKVLLSQIKQLEKEAILNTDYRIAVSNKLVEYWDEAYGYKGVDHVVIPCTLNKLFRDINLSDRAISKARVDLGFGEEDIVFVYSGSVAGWQSFELIYNFLYPIFKAYANSKVLFLTDKNESISKLENEFFDRIVCEKVSSEAVPSYLLAADYGLLIREKSITNKVASPVKFAEYLACGLPVIISDDLGDYSGFVSENNCGSIINSISEFNRTSMDQRIELRNLAMRTFLKESYEYTFVANIN